MDKPNVVIIVEKDNIIRIESSGLDHYQILGVLELAKYKIVSDVVKEKR
jgi:hypothetical protein